MKTLSFHQTFFLLQGLVLALSLALHPAVAQEEVEESSAPLEEAVPAGHFSITSPEDMAQWQKKLTLGSGDVLNIGLYQQPDLTRENLAIGPDGRLNYLQAQNVLAAGLTVDELREKLETELAKFYLPPLRVIIVPQAFNSKKYYVLGNVVQKGVFQLRRPVTLIEALAQARGFITTDPRTRNTLMLADLSRSFLMRRQASEEFERQEVDFEALFLRGDLSQNIALEPDDYLYFPPLDIAEVYVLGDGIRPGVVLHTEGLSLLRAITIQGGFLDKAFRSRVLVVRGSLNQPETFVVNMNEILHAESPDFKLEPRDIIYVSRRPWAKAEELVEVAVTQFFRAAFISWTGLNVGPFINEPIIK